MSLSQPPLHDLWEELQFLMKDLYITQNLGVKKVMSKMSSEFNFHASETQYRSMLRKWDWGKNLKREDWLRLGQAIKKNGWTQESGYILINGRLIHWEKIKKELARNVPLTESAIQDLNRRLKSTTSIRFEAYHKRFASTDQTVTQELPWHAFCHSLGPAVQISTTTITGTQVASATVILPLETVLMRNITAFGSTSNSLHLGSITLAKSIYEDLRGRLIEIEDMHLAENVATIYHGDRELGLYHLFRYFMYIQSNNMGNDEALNDFVTQVVMNDRAALRTLLSLKGITALAVKERLMSLAIQKDNSELLRDILRTQPFDQALRGGLALRLMLNAISMQSCSCIIALLDTGYNFHNECVDACKWSMTEASFRNIAKSTVFRNCLSRLLHAVFASDQPPRGHCLSVMFLYALLSNSMDAQVLNQIFKAGMNKNALINVYKTLYVTPLQAAVCIGNQAHVEIVLNHGANANGLGIVHDNAGLSPAPPFQGAKAEHLVQTPLILAVMRGRADIVETLLSAGSDLFPSCEDLSEPRYSGTINWFFFWCFRERLDYDNSRFLTPLEAAISRNRTEIFEQLLTRVTRLEDCGLERLYQLARDLGRFAYIETLSRCPSERNCDSEIMLDGFIDEFRMREGFFSTVVKSSMMLETPLSLAHIVDDASAQFHCHIALSALLRQSVSLKTGTGSVKWWNLTPCHALAIILLLERNCDFFGEPIKAELWKSIQEELLMGYIDALTRSLRIPSKLRCWRSGVALEHHIGSSNTCCCTPFDGPALSAMTNLTGIAGMIAKGLNVNSDSSTFRSYRSIPSIATPLLVAIRYGDHDLVNWLLAHGARPNQMISSQKHERFEYIDISCELLEAFRTKQFGLARPLVSTGASLRGLRLWSEIVSFRDSEPDINGMGRDYDCVRMLVDVVVDVDMTVEYSQVLRWLTTTRREAACSELRPCCRRRQLAEIDYMLAKGANVNFLSPDGRYDPCFNTYSPLPHRVEGLPYHTFDRLSAFQLAFYHNDQELVGKYLTFGGEINAPINSCHGRTALQIAAQNGHIDLVEQLLDEGADLHAQPSHCGGVTALQAAAIGGYVPIAKLLIQRGASVSQTAAPKQGRTALQGAAEWGRLDMIQLLLNHYDGSDRQEACMDAATYAEKENFFVLAQFLRDEAKK